MFHELKRRFVIINMVLLTFVFTTIFGVIFVLAAISGERQTDFALHTMMNAPPRPAPPNPMSASSIIVDLDHEDNLVRILAFWQIDQRVLENAVKNVMSSKLTKTKVKMDDTYYASLKRTTPEGTRIVFVDRTPQRNTMISLMLIFVVVGGISLIILFFISLYLAGRSIKPIQESFDKQKQFIADASHELKTPLTIIKTNLSVINANKEETVKSQSKWLDYISSQTDRLARLVNEMLSLASLDYEGQEMILSEFNMSRIVEGELLSFEAAAFENKIALTTQIEPEIKLKGDKDSTKRLISILMDNAIKNTPENGEISVLLQKDKNIIKMEVENTGKGISPEQLEKVFERFYRVDSARAREQGMGGYGLGLAIARKIVERYKGKIYVKSNLGLNTTFVVELPSVS